MIITLFILSIVGGLLSGLLGVGGAVIMIPMMLTIPPMIGLEALTMNQVASISMLQVLAASITGCLTHRRDGFVHTKALLTIGIPMGIFSLLGAIFSKRMDDRTMLMLYGLLVFTAFVILLIKKVPHDQDTDEDIDLHTALSAFIGCFVGLTVGIIGAGGGFIIIPLMILMLKMPMRVAVGSSLGIIFISSLMGSIGKIVSMQVNWLHVAPVIVGAIPSARIGAMISKKISPAIIKRLLLILVFLCCAKTAWDLFS